MVINNFYFFNSIDFEYRPVEVFIGLKLDNDGYTVIDIEHI